MNFTVWGRKTQVSSRSPSLSVPKGPRERPIRKRCLHAGTRCQQKRPFGIGTVVKGFLKDDGLVPCDAADAQITNSWTIGGKRELLSTESSRGSISCS